MVLPFTPEESSCLKTKCKLSFVLIFLLNKVSIFWRICFRPLWKCLRSLGETFPFRTPGSTFLSISRREIFQRSPQSYWTIVDSSDEMNGRYKHYPIQMCYAAAISRENSKMRLATTKSASRNERKFHGEGECLPDAKRCPVPLA